MSDLHPEFELLISYADGNADTEMQKKAVDLIRTDPDAAEFYKSMQATALALGENAEREENAVPQDIIDRIKGARIDQLEQQPEGDNHTAAIQPSVKEDQARKGSNRSDGFGPAVFPVSIAASLLCGLIGGALLFGAPDSLMSNTGQVEVNATADTPEWVRLVADYHRLYVRETITASGHQDADVVSQQVSEKLRTKLSVPSLEKQSIEFRRAQWLAIDNQPLLQLAYLPESGNPLAVCVLKKNKAENSAAEYGETGGMNYVHWQTGEHAIVIVGMVSQVELQEIYNVVEQELL